MAACSASPDWAIPFGVPVHTTDGERLGVLTDATAYELIIEVRGRMHHTVLVPLAEIDRVEHGVLILGVTHQQVRERSS